MIDEEAATIVSTRSISGASGEGAVTAELTRYQLGDKLGAGGMAAVYRAHDRVTGGTVALKIIENGDDDSSRQARFEREVRAAGRLVHPNICRVLSFGRAPSQLFMAMEIVDGLTLQRVIKARGTVPVAVAVEALRQLLSALSCAHQAGVVHRDLKPANIMITPAGVLKLLDFGIAKSQEDATVTATGLLIGTPAFMAPEQILGSGTDPRSDLFSAGVTFLVMLTGHTRFTGLDPATVMMKVTSEPVGSLLEECPSAPNDVDAFLQKLCAQTLADRFPTADAALAALSALGDVTAQGEALLARYIAAPDDVAGSLARASADTELKRAERLLRLGPAAHPAAALSLYRAQLLDPAEPTRRKLADLCASSSLTFDPVDDPRIAEALASFQKTPNAAGVLKRLADLYKARGHVLSAASFLVRYLRVKPGDTHAATQLSVLLDGPADVSSPSSFGSGAGTGERLRTRDIMAGIKTGGHAEHRPQPQPGSPGSPGSPSSPSTQSGVMRKTGNGEPPQNDVTLLRPPTLQGGQQGLRLQTAQQVRNVAPSMSVGGAPAVIVAAGHGEARSLNIHPLLYVVAAILVAGVVIAVFGRFVRTTVDDVQLAVSDNEQRAGQAERSNIDKLRKNYLDEAKGQFERGNWAAAARQANLLIATNPPAEQALEAMWLRSQARLKLDDKRSARVDLEEYLKQTPLTDPHREEAKKLLDGIYADQAAAAATPNLTEPGQPLPTPAAQGGLF